MGASNEFVKLVRSMSPNEIVEGLSDLSTISKKLIIAKLKQSLGKISFQYGQVCKVLLRDAGEKFGVIIGGGQKAKMWIMGTPSDTFYKVAWDEILEQFADALYVNKQGKYHWPVNKLENEEQYKSNQKLIAKYLNGRSTEKQQVSAE
jgi:hypothetical protein